jgi:cell division protein FtsQ
LTQTTPGAPVTQATVTQAATADDQDGAQAARRRRRRHDPWRTAFFVGVVVALVAGVAWALLGSSFFVVRSVDVTGTAPVPAPKVVAAAGVRLGTPLVRIDTGAVARRVERLTWVQSAKVRTSWPDEVIISTVGRTPVFAVRSGHDYDVIDRYGVILRHDARSRRGVIWLKMILKPAVTLRGSAIVYAAGTVVRELPGWLRHRIASVRAPAPARVILVLRHGVTVVWGGTGWAHQKARELSVLLRTKATYYDVSDPQSALTGWPGA